MKNHNKLIGWQLDLYRVHAALDVVLSLVDDFPREKIDSILELTRTQVEALIDELGQFSLKHDAE